MKTLSTLLLTLLVSGSLWADDELIALVCEFETSPTNILSYTPEDIIIILNKKDKTLSPSETKLVGIGYRNEPLPYLLNERADEYVAAKTVYLYEGSKEGNWESFSLNRITLKLTRDWRKKSPEIDKNHLSLEAMKNNWIRIYQCKKRDLL